MNQAKCRRKCFVIIWIFFIIGIINWYYPILRFESPTINQLSSLLLYITPLILIILGSISIKNVIIKGLLGVLLFIPCLLGIFGFLLTIMDIKTSIHDRGIDPSFKPIHKIEMKHSWIVIYQTNGGAMTDFGISVRQEKRILPGLLLVKDLYNKYHKEDVRFKKVDNKTVNIEGKSYNLKNNLYFN